LTAAPPGERGQRLGSSERPLAEAYDAALYDLDGVLYLGAEPVPHAAASVAAARTAGLRAAFVTNNASRRPAVVADHLTELGIPAAAEDVVTSAQAAVRVLRERLAAGAVVLVVGAPGLAEEVEAGGFRPVREASQDVAAVVQGYDRDTGWVQLAEASIALRAGALWVATNNDSTLPSPRGPLPGNGALVAALRVATGLEPLVAGKPEPALHLESIARVRAERPLVVGDRLDTDVLGAVRGGADSLLVLTGVVDALAVLRAPRGSRPTYVAPDLRGLLEGHPPVTVGGDQAVCGAATASYDEGRITLLGEGTSALRAGCALAWSCADEGRPVTECAGSEQ
jgi:HAD superfamily hydrolase (TIGR01450 family)